VEDGVPPPNPADCLEDWIRVPAVDADIRLRLSALAMRAGAHVQVTPLLDVNGVIRFSSRWASLPPVEARLSEPLVKRFGTVVSRDELYKLGWPEGAPGRNALDSHVLRLRRRLSPLGLAIRTVRSRGYLMETLAPGGKPGIETESPAN
jgi:two-component system OmpR family response regulator